MNTLTSSDDAWVPLDAASIASAEQTLSGLNGQIGAMRSVLTRLLQDVVQADNALSNHQSVQMREANEFLTLSALQAHTQLETNAVKLDQAVLATGIDVLTGLPNRTLFLDRMEQAIQVAKRGGNRLAVLFIDLDNFKQVNDELGHAVGDEVLKMTTRCLTDAVRAVDTVSRHGGDEFLVLLASVATTADAVAVAEKIVAAVARLKPPSQAGMPELQMGASIGISMYPDHGTDGQTLIERADAAMYRVKRTQAGGCAVHGQPIASDATQAFKLASRAELRMQHGQHQVVVADMQLRQLVLQEANERLVLSALTAQELQAAAELALQRQTEFLAAVKTELDDPAAPIRIAAQMLGRRRTDEPLLPMAQAMLDQRTEALARLIGVTVNGIAPEPAASKSEPAARPFTRLSKSPSDAPSNASFSAVDLREVVNAAVGAFESELTRRAQRMEVVLPDADLTVFGNAEMLEQALSNLLSNASKYSRDSGVITLRVKVTPHVFVLTVSDTGIGISAAVLPNVFEPFVQDTHAIGFNGVGLGIGLTAVREVIKAHRGSVEARSAGEGQGSQFIVTLPRGFASSNAK